MPVIHKKTKPEEHSGLVEELRRVLRENKSSGPPGEPQIVFEEIPHSNSLHVTVTWDKWKEIDPQERGRIILSAIAAEKGEDEMLRVTMALGLTPQEARRLNVD
jgi:hypothetical protein